MIAEMLVVFVVFCDHSRAIVYLPTTYQQYKGVNNHTVGATDL